MSGKSMYTNPNIIKNNPCYKEESLSYKCLEENNYDHDKCEIVFENYKICKKFWGFVQSDRRWKRIRPFLPPPEEREQIKKEYLTNKKPS